MSESSNSVDVSGRKVTRRAFTRSIGLGIFGTGIVSGADETTEQKRWVVGTESGYGTNFVVQQSDRVEKTVDLGEHGDALIAQFTPETAKQLERTATVRYVEEDVDVGFPESTKTVASESLPASAEEQHSPWGCNRIGAVPIHGANVTGRGVDIAIIDSGIDSNHPDLQSNLGEGYATTSCSGDECQQEWDDDHLHGTHCAGVIGALDNGQGVIGVAPDVTLHAVKVMSAAGSGSGSDIADGIVWAADNGCEVANVSLGTDSPSEAVHDAIKYATKNGTLVVAAAGNGGPCSDCLHYPGAYEETLCVGAINQDEELAEFSLTGDAVDIVAPGAEIPSTVLDGEYSAFSGTSMATPHVVGAAALLISAGLTPGEAKQRLLKTAKDIGLAENEGGNGLVDCEAALSGVLEPSASIETGAVSRVRMQSATVSGKLTEVIGMDSVTVGVEYWPASESPDTAIRARVGSRSAPGQFDVELTGLERETEYRYRAICRGEADATGSTQSFTTRENPPKVAATMDSVSDVTATTATFAGDLTTLEGAEAATVNFEYWAEGDREETLVTTERVEQTSTGTVTQQVDGLDPDTTYVVRAGAAPAGGEIVYSKRKTFTTADGLTVSATGATDVSLYGARLQGEVLSMGPTAQASVGFRYWEPGEDKDSTVVEAGTQSETGPFEAKTIDLQQDTKYFYEAYARSENGKEVSSGPVSFTTGGNSW